MNDNVPAKSPVVALFGFYRYGNFGDDLMAAIIGRHLDQECVVKAFGPSIPNGDTMIPGTDSIEGLVEGSKLVVYGGGGAFLRQREGKPVLAFDSELSELCRLVEENQLPVHLVSVGGDGSPPSRLSDARQHLLSISTSGTFRNVEEQSLLDAIDGPTHVFDDLVWVTPRYFGNDIEDSSGPSDSEPLIIGVDGHLYRSRLMRIYIRAISTWCRLFRTNTNIRVLWQHKAALPKGFPSDAIVYRDLDEFVGAIAESHIIITSRLHMGMVAMSYGRTVVGFRPSPKQRLLFKRFGRSHLLFQSAWDAVRLAVTVGRRGSARDFAARNRYAEGSDRALAAAQHLNELDQVVHNLRVAG